MRLTCLLCHATGVRMFEESCLPAPEKIRSRDVSIVEQVAFLSNEASAIACVLFPILDFGHRA